MIKLDDIDIELLTLLQENSDVNVKSLSDQLGITKTPIYERIKRYEKEGIIEKYVAILNLEKVNDFMVVFCSVSLETQNLDMINAFTKSVLLIPEVIECYLMGGANDFLLKVVVKNLKEYHHFSSGKLATLSNVREIKSTFVLKEVKHSTIYPIL